MLLISIAGVLLITVNTIGYANMNQMAKSAKDMYSKQLLSIDAIAKLKMNNQKMDAYMLEAMLSKDKTYTKELLDNIQMLINENMSVEKPELFPKEIVDFDTYGELVGKLSKVRSHSLDLASQNKNQEAYTYYVTHVSKQKGELEELSNRIIDYHEKQAAKVNQENKAKIQKATTIFSIMSIAGLAVLIGVGLFISRMISKPLMQIQGLLAKAENGDFTESSDYESKDELGQLSRSYNKMIDGVKETLYTVSENAELVVASSTQLNASAEQSTQASAHIATTIQELAAGSERQLRSVEESSNTVEHISDSAVKISNNANGAAENAAISAQLSAEGKKNIENMIEQMNEINENVAGLSKTVQALSDRSAQIGSINDAITAIADQTNLLALNAAIEAARAGEQGKGFAVVAEEVRKLAEQSVHSADQIAELIKTIQTDTDNTLDSMKTTAEGVDKGIEVAQNAGQSFEKIETAVRDVTNQIQDVASAILKLSSETKQVAVSMEDVKGIAEEAAASSQTVSAGTEEQLASMEEIESSAENLNHVSEELQEAVSRFTLNKAN